MGIVGKQIETGTNTHKCRIGDKVSGGVTPVAIVKPEEKS